MEQSKRSIEVNYSQRLVGESAIIYPSRAGYNNYIHQRRGSFWANAAKTGHRKRRGGTLKRISQDQEQAGPRRGKEGMYIPILA